MSLKQIGVSVIIIAIAAVLYYLSVGSSQLTQELKAEVDQELLDLQSQGFEIDDRKSSYNSEHFEIVFDDTVKIANYLNEKGASFTDEESASLKGMRIGVDLFYPNDIYSSISFDLYPTLLPTALTQGQLSAKDKQVLAKINALFDTKTFLIHVDINSMLNEFKGYMKDINESIGEPGEQVTLQIKAMSFDGEMDKDTITSVHQTLEHFLLKAEDDLFIQLLGIKSNYRLTGPTRYDITTGYSVDKISLTDALKESMTIDHIEANSTTIMQNDLAKREVSSKVDSIEYSAKRQTNRVTNLILDMKISNLDIQSFEALQQADGMDQQQINTVAQKIISKGVSIEIPKFSVDGLDTQQNNLDGFSISAKIDIDRNLNFSDLQANPMLGLLAINADLNLTFSETLHTFISQQPQVLIAIMMFQPQEKNGNEVYQINLQNGKFTVNGIVLK